MRPACPWCWRPRRTLLAVARLALGLGGSHACRLRRARWTLGCRRWRGATATYVSPDAVADGRAFRVAGAQLRLRVAARCHRLRAGTQGASCSSLRLAASPSLGVCQFFAPLLTQLTDWFTSAAMGARPETAPLLSVLLDGLVDAEDPA